MPPRPRPRPVNRSAGDAATSQTTSQTSSASASHTVKSARERELDNDDQIFIRNKTRTAQDWKRIEQIEKESKVEIADSSSSESEGSTPRKRRKVQKDAKENKGKKSANGLPEWTRHSSVTLLSDSEDELEILEGPPGRQRSTGNAVKISRKPERDRSRSLTPPPKLTMQQLQNARNVVRQALQSSERAPSPEIGNDSFDISSDTVVLDPELASIAKAITKQQSSFGGHNRQRLEPAGDRGGGPELVTIRVTWRPHPLNSNGKPEVFPFYMKRHDNFHKLLAGIADKKAVIEHNIVLTYERSRVVAGATPHSLKVWAEADMDASDKITFEYLRANPAHGQAGSSQLHGSQHGRAPSLEPGDSERHSDSESETQSQDSTEDETLKLVLRSALTMNKNITLTVRPATTCGAIVKAFLKKSGLTGKGARARLVVDGEKMNPETPISEADLEDGDQVEVEGL